MFAITEEFVELAVELIDDFLDEPNAIWVSIPNDDVPNLDEPWNVEREESIETPVKIVFTMDALEDRQLLKYLKGTEANDGQINGLMYPQGFEPKLKDIVKFDGQELVVRAIDPIKPFDKPIIYIMEFGS